MVMKGLYKLSARRKGRECKEWGDIKRDARLYSMTTEILCVGVF